MAESRWPVDGGSQIHLLCIYIQIRNKCLELWLVAWLVFNTKHYEKFFKRITCQFLHITKSGLFWNKPVLCLFVFYQVLIELSVQNACVIYSLGSHKQFLPGHCKTCPHYHISHIEYVTGTRDHYVHRFHDNIYWRISLLYIKFCIRLATFCLNNKISIFLSPTVVKISSADKFTPFFVWLK